MCLVSLIIPTCDRADHLTCCLNSLERHGYLSNDTFEVIVVDNNSSTSETWQVCKEYQAIKYVFERKQGRSAALNTGIKNAKGVYIAFTDDDVIVKDPKWLTKLVSNFESQSEVGYVSGNVTAYSCETRSQRMWERKGGLSKGNQRRQFGYDFFKQKCLSGVPIRLIAAGANCMIPKYVFDKIGYYDEAFGIGSIIPHGESLDICYRVLQEGYMAVYDPKATIFHLHPRTLSSLRRKMFIYGIGDTATHMKFFIKYEDIRSLFEILWGRPFLLLGRLIKSLFGIYPMSPDMLVAGFFGALIGPWIYIYVYLFSKR